MNVWSIIFMWNSCSLAVLPLSRNKVISSLSSNMRRKTFPRNNQRNSIWNRSTLNSAPTSSHNTENSGVRSTALDMINNYNNLREDIDETRGNDAFLTYSRLTSLHKHCQCGVNIMIELYLPGGTNISVN